MATLPPYPRRTHPHRPLRAIARLSSLFLAPFRLSVTATVASAAFVPRRRPARVGISPPTGGGCPSRPLGNPLASARGASDDHGGAGGTAVSEDAKSEGGGVEERRPCRYLFEGRWRSRIELSDLTVGQHLRGTKLDGCDLLDGVTGPKVFFECGVGRIDATGEWRIVNGMLRLGRRGAKRGVTKKRAAKLSGKPVDLYVSRIDLDSGRLEVSTSPEQVEEMAANMVRKVPASTLEKGQELVGTVVRVEPYGVLVDVGANRNGLLHIQRVADLMGRYIPKEDGLADAGLERGAKIRVAVRSNESKRLFLDFTDHVKAEAEAEREGQKGGGGGESSPLDEAGRYDISGDEAAAWAAYGASGGGISEDEAAEWATFAAGDAAEKVYDEDDDIEDALGISTY